MLPSERRTCSPRRTHHPFVPMPRGEPHPRDEAAQCRVTWVMLNPSKGLCGQVPPGQREEQQPLNLKSKYELPEVKFLSVSTTVPTSHT